MATPILALIALAGTQWLAIPLPPADGVAAPAPAPVLALAEGAVGARAMGARLPELAARAGVPLDTPQARPRAIEYGDAYYTRLKIHRIGSYAMLPLFGAEYLLGDKLLSGGDVAGWVKPTHVAVATGLGALFAVNTVTGVWNLWEGRKDPTGRTRRLLHSALMIATDAGMVWTAAAAGDAEHNDDGARHHRDVALGTFALGTAGTLMMWLWND